MSTRGKVSIGLVALLLVAGLAVRSQQARIGTALFERAVDARVGRDATAGLADGLHVALCGTGSPLPNPARAGPCNVVIVGKHVFVVDIGEGGGRNINVMGMPLGRIEGVFLTHFHSDHIDGMGPLMMMRWTAGTNSFFYPAFLGDAASRFGGPIVVGEDGMMFSLPAGSSEIKQTRLM